MPSDTLKLWLFERIDVNDFGIAMEYLTKETHSFIIFIKFLKKRIIT